MKTNANSDIYDDAVIDSDNSKKYGFDLNPFTTEGARTAWKNGFENKRPANLVDGSGLWRMWERGRMANFISQSVAQENVEVSLHPVLRG